MVAVPAQVKKQPRQELNPLQKQPRQELNLQQHPIQQLAAQPRLKLCCDHDSSVSIVMAPEYSQCAKASSWWR